MSDQIDEIMRNYRTGVKKIDSKYKRVESEYVIESNNENSKNESYAFRGIKGITNLNTEIRHRQNSIQEIIDILNSEDLSDSQRNEYQKEIDRINDELKSLKESKSEELQNQSYTVKGINNLNIEIRHLEKNIEEIINILNNEDLSNSQRNEYQKELDKIQEQVKSLKEQRRKSVNYTKELKDSEVKLPTLGITVKQKEKDQMDKNILRMQAVENLEAERLRISAEIENKKIELENKRKEWDSFSYKFKEDNKGNLRSTNDKEVTTIHKEYDSIKREISKLEKAEKRCEKYIEDLNQEIQKETEKIKKSLYEALGNEKTETIKQESEPPQEEIPPESEPPQEEIPPESEPPQEEEVPPESEPPQEEEIPPESKPPQEEEIPPESEPPQEEEVPPESEPPQESLSDRDKIEKLLGNSSPITEFKPMPDNHVKCKLEDGTEYILPVGETLQLFYDKMALNPEVKVDFGKIQSATTQNNIPQETKPQGENTPPTSQGNTPNNIEDVDVVVGKNVVISIGESESFEISKKEFKKSLSMTDEDKEELLNVYNDNEKALVKQLIELGEFDICVLNAITNSNSTTDKNQQISPNVKKQVAKQYLDQCLNPKENNDIKIQYDEKSLLKNSIFNRLDKKQKSEILQIAQTCQNKGIAFIKYKKSLKEKIKSLIPKKRLLLLSSKFDKKTTENETEELRHGFIKVQKSNSQEKETLQEASKLNTNATYQNTNNSPYKNKSEEWRHEFIIVQKAADVQTEETLQGQYNRIYKDNQLQEILEQDEEDDYHLRY